MEKGREKGRGPRGEREKGRERGRGSRGDREPGRMRRGRGRTGRDGVGQDVTVWERRECNAK